ncbi:uncharacterized protein LOC134533271 isoform X2 [Bacillus rossius redtenbacheri]|uniref:uncharacterized protein LOC134533271 isoform X2 n=1 Tax=Bacillus rossius redtenbacheri TaxID=93214 RepID=UPI002FDE7DDE
MAVPRDITFPLLKQEADWAPQELSFPGIKDEVVDDDEADYAWWELRPCKPEPGFQAVKDELLEHDYQAGAAPLQDLSSSNTGYFGCEDTQEWCDEDLSTSQMRHTNKFMIDSDPEELDEFLHCNIALESKEAGAQTDTCDNNFVCKEFLKGCEQDGGNAVNSLIRPLVASQLDHDTKKILFSSAHSPEDVIIILDDDDDDDNHNEEDFHDSGIDDNDPVVTDNGCGPSGSECGNDIETIVIDDDDDLYTNSLDCELQQEKCHMKSAHNGLEFSADIPIAPTKKRKRKQEKNNIKCILQFDGNQTKKIPVISKEESTNTVKSNKKTRVSQSMNSEVNIDMAQEISLNQALHNDKEQPTDSVDKASVKKLKMSNQLETLETGYIWCCRPDAMNRSLIKSGRKTYHCNAYTLALKTVTILRMF